MTNYIRLMILPLYDAKCLQDSLLKQNIEIKLDHNETTCTRGCAVTVEVLVKEEDLQKAYQAYQKDLFQHTQDHQINWDAVNAIFDPNQAEAICPACTCRFSTKLTECPDCGLVFQA